MSYGFIDTLEIGRLDKRCIMHGDVMFRDLDMKSE
jgi:hypothetical protein